MAVKLLGSTNSQISHGVVAALAGGPTNVTWYWAGRIIGNPADGLRFWTQASTTKFDIEVQDNDELAFAVTPNGSNFHTRKTSGVNLANGSLYRIAVRCVFGSPPVVKFFVNGVLATDVDWFGAFNLAALPNSPGQVQFGFDSGEGIDGVDIEVSDLAIWNAARTDAELISLTAGWSPRFYYGGRALYSTCLKNETFHLRDQWGGVAPVVSNGTTVEHIASFLPQGAAEHA